MQQYKMWINGKWVGAESGRTYPVVNPANEEVIAEVPLGDRADVDKAVAAARRAFPVWSQKTQAERSRIVSRIAAALGERLEEVARIEMLDHGAPINAARGMHVGGSVENLEYAAQVSRVLMGSAVPVNPAALTYIQREPVGVCALITPWNFPLLMVAWKLGFALAAGNTCVIKPPSIDSLSTLKLAEVLESVDLPPGTVNVITGPGGTVGEALASHPGVDKIAFTGSCDTGKDIMACASRSVKRVGLELGGKNPFIVLPDADIDAAVEGGVFASFCNSGMICASPGRYYVHESIHDEFVEKFVAAAGKIVVGDPASEKTQMGPLVSAEHRDKVEGYIRSGVAEGAKLVLGGKRPAAPPLNKGYFVMPAVFTGVTQDMTIAREEIFGPVVCIMKYLSEDRVVALANDNTFGLCASVWTRDMPKGIRMANEIRAGWVWINEHLMLAPGLPWGGYKESGIGKDGSIHTLDEYTELKVIYADLTGATHKPWHVL
ncbi:MAG: aldehyde dehydrogenase family protein [Dehalococcoidales bacterium]|jgi:acyl-CoA reductase-like NAD-dependent aldehyde dehydrogenase